MHELNTYKVKITDFEGPFDLLLFFVEKKELDIQKINIKELIHDFLNYLQAMKQMNFHISSEFIFMASQLIRIKAISLFPHQVVQQEEEQMDETKLKDHLIEFLKYKQVGIYLKTLEQKRFPRRHFQVKESIKNVFKNYDTQHLKVKLPTLYQFYKIFEKLEQKNQTLALEPIEVIEIPYTVKKEKKQLKALFQVNHLLTSISMMERSKNKFQFLCMFLGVLELLNESFLSIDVGMGYNNFTLKKR